MRYKGNFIIIAKDGWPLEQFENSPVRNFFRRLFLASHKECRACQPTNTAPAEQLPDFDGWERYWASLDTDSQEKLTSSGGLEGARAWFGIGAVWGRSNNGPARESYIATMRSGN
jgi:hypothetical protein